MRPIAFHEELEMHSFVRFSLLVSTALVAVPAAAEAADDEAQQTSSVGTGATQPDEEILVTARRRQEASQDVPLAISVIGGEHLDNTGAFNVGRLQQLTPTLQFYTSNPRNSAVNIRGLGAPFGLTNDGIEQGVGIYVDDVYYSRAASSTFDFLDVARIEVLRGPQGTLYGKNTTAGALNITSRQPSFDFEGRAEGGRYRATVRYFGRARRYFGDQPQGHAVQHRHGQLGQRAGQPGNARAAAVAAERQCRSDAGGRLFGAGP
jgi:outer membrane receptor protein involved in Fe transport